MNIEIKKESLFKTLSLIEKITSKAASLPILNCVLIEVGKTVSVSATNLEIGAVVDIPAKVVEKGKVAVPAGTLFRLIMNTNGEYVKIEEKGTTLVITSGKERSTLKLNPVDDFPIIPSSIEGKTVTIHSQDLLKGIRSVWYSASTSLIKPEIASVYINGVSGKITFAATDSFRLAERIISHSGKDSFGPILIPSRSIGDIVRVLEGVSGDITLTFNEHQLSFTGDGVYLTTRLSTGSFPDYHQIIPKSFSTEVTVLKHDILQAFKKTSIFLDTFQQVHFAIHPKQKIFTVSVTNAEVGTTEHPVPASVVGDAIDINFNQKYIADALSVISTDSIVFGFNGLGKALVMRGVSDTTSLSLIMPMNR